MSSEETKERPQEFILQQSDEREDRILTNKLSPVEVVLRSRSTRGIVFLLIFAIVVPVLIYYFVVNRGSYPDDGQNTCLVEKGYRIRCGKLDNVTIAYCNMIHCCFDNSTNLCFHYLPSKYYYFKGENSERTDYQRSLVHSPYKRDLKKNIFLSVKEISENKLEIILYDDNETSQNDLQKNYFWNISHDPLYVDVFRSDTQDLLLTTSKGPTILSENYWEWSFHLTDEYLFGLGQTLINVPENSTFTRVIYGNSEDHTTLPVFMAYKKGLYHGAKVRHSGPLEVTILPSKLVSLKSLSGKKIVLELCVGPTVQDVIEQQRGTTSNVIDPNILGVHICREGNVLTLNEILSEYETLDYVYESDCLHENLVIALASETNEKLIDQIRTTIQSMNEHNTQFVLSVVPQVSVSSDLYGNISNDLDIFYKFNESTVYEGRFLGTKVAYPYFQHTSIDKFTEYLIEDLKTKLTDLWPTQFMLSSNWPSDDSFTMEELDDFQYMSKDLIEAMSSTLPWNIISENQLQFLDHNDYGHAQVKALEKALGEEVFIMTASHNIDTMRPIIIQNVDISWTNFKKAITTTLYNSIFGYPLSSIPVCGSTSNFNASHESLCLRWYLMASTAPIFRISSDLPRRDPKSLASEYAVNIAKEAIEFRYSLQRYFYTVLYNSEPLMRPMFYDFPNDNETFGLVEQYMVGGSIMVAHPTLPDQSQISIYLPKSVNTWYEFWGGAAYNYNSGKNGWLTFPIVETDWIGFIPEGAIIPLTEKVSGTDEETIRLKVALKCDNSRCNATGNLVLLENQFTFFSNEQSLDIKQNSSGAIASNSFIIREITLYNGTKTEVYDLEVNIYENVSWPYPSKN